MERSYAEIKVIYPSQTWPEVLFVEFFVAGCWWVFACCDSVSSCCVTALWAFGSAVIQLSGTGTSPYPAPPPEETGLANLLIRIGMQLIRFPKVFSLKHKAAISWCLFSTRPSPVFLYKLHLLQYTIYNMVPYFISIFYLFIFFSCFLLFVCFVG